MSTDWQLRLGRWQDVLTDVEEIDCVFTDPPYSEATSRGQRGCRTSSLLGSVSHPGITYSHITRDDVVEFVARWRPRRWFVVFGDHISAEWWRLELEASGLYAFPPVPWVKTDAAPRIMADGPSPQHETITIARTRRQLTKAEKRYRPGWYRGPGAIKGSGFVGSKPEWLMRALIRDYSQPGDLVVDPCAGLGTTLLAAIVESRQAIGSEQDESTYRRAVERLSQGYTPSFESVMEGAS